MLWRFWEWLGWRLVLERVPLYVWKRERQCGVTHAGTEARGEHGHVCRLARGHIGPHRCPCHAHDSTTWSG